MRKLLLALMIGMFLFSFATAEVNSLGTIKQSECIQIPQVCASCSYVNLSVQYPNKSIAISNQGMTPNGAGLWTYEFCNTNQLGRYDVTGIGDLNGVDTGFSVLWFEVSRQGTQTTTGQGIIYVVSATLVFLLFLLTLYFAISIPWADHRRSDGSILYIDYKKYLKFVMAFVSYLILMFFMFIGKGMSYSFLDSTELYGFFNVASSIMVIAIAPVLIVSVVFLIFSVLTDKKISKAIERGIPIR